MCKAKFGIVRTRFKTLNNYVVVPKAVYISVAVLSQVFVPFIMECRVCDVIQPYAVPLEGRVP